MVKKFCPNISFLFIGSQSEQFQDAMIQAIQPICDLPLKLLSTRIGGSLVSKALGDYLKSVEWLYLNFFIDLPSFEYFINNCKANFS